MKQNSQEFIKNYIFSCYKNILKREPDELGLSHFIKEIQENNYNLNVPRYVDISSKEEEINITKLLEELKKLESDKFTLELDMKHYLKKLGLEI